MNRNTNSHFAMNPQVDIERSKFPRHNGFKTTADAGKLFVFHVDEILPGDTFEVGTSSLFRMSTPLYPVMDNCYLDYYYFFVPNRLVWEHWEQFMGASESAWDSQIQYQIPQLSVPDNGFQPHSLADYMGIPTLTGEGDSVNALPFRCYRKIWNDWFRDQNVMNEVFLNLGDDGDVNDDEDYQLYDLLPVSKLHDYFSTCSPQPQRGPDVMIPLVGDAPVVTGIEHLDSSAFSIGQGLKFVGGASDTSAFGNGTYHTLAFESTANNTTIDRVSGNLKASASNDIEDITTPRLQIAPSNLWVDFDGAQMATITELRSAFALQRFFETSARGGSRYTELIRSFFGVVSPDGRLQRSEYLGGKRVPINVQDVTQTGGDGINPIGNQTAYSKTVDSTGSFTRSFTEHGYLIGVACIRADRNYQQGLNRLWSRKDRLDFYFPQFNGVGDQPVYNREIYWQDADVTADRGNNGVFGYQERYGEYRYMPSFVTGAFRSNYPGGSLDVWHYADNYDELPKLSAEWMAEDGQNIARTLATTDAYAGQQFIIDMYIHKFCTRPMPVYSVPGLYGRF